MCIYIGEAIPGARLHTAIEMCGPHLKLIVSLEAAGLSARLGADVLRPVSLFLPGWLAGPLLHPTLLQSRNLCSVARRGVAGTRGLPFLFQLCKQF